MKLIAANRLEQAKSFYDHVHPYHEFQYILGGHGRMEIEGKTHPLTAGALVCILPGQHHRLMVDGTAPVTKYVISILFSLRDKSDKAHANVIQHVIAESQVIRPGGFDSGVFERIIGGKSAGEYRKQAGCFAMLSLLYELAGETESAKLIGENEAMRSVKTLLERSTDKLLTLGDIAATQAMSKENLIRSFKRATGMTPMRYFAKLKVDTACHLLAGKKMPVYMVASRLGFSDEYRFSKVFRRIMGCTPTEFRKRGPIERASGEGQ